MSRITKMTSRVPAVGVIADDLTGGAAIAAELAAAGLPGSLVRDLGILTGEPEVVVVDTASRYAPPQEACAATGKAVEELQALGCLLLMKKVDSALRGNVAADITRFAAQVRAPVLLAPACPYAGWVTRNGRHHGPTGAAIDLREVLAAALASSVPVIPLDVIRSGRHTVTAAITVALRRPDASLLVADAVTPTDLAEVVTAAVEAGIRYFAGTYGVGAALAAVTAPAQRITCAGLGCPDRVLALVGSFCSTAHQQIEYARSVGAHVVHADMPAVIEGRQDDEAQRVAAEIASLGSRDVIVQSAPSPARAAEAIQLYERLGWDQTRLAAGLAPVLSAAVDAATAGGRSVTVAVVGGETAGSLFEYRKMGQLDVKAELDPGAPLSIIRDGTALGQPLLTKPGAFGDDATLARLMARAKLCTD